MNHIRVLVVDDNAPFLDAVTLLLNRLVGVRVVGCAKSAAEGLAQADALRPDLILMDVMMPGMSGLEALARIKQRGDAPRVAIVTLYDDEHWRTAALESGADGFIAKGNLLTELPALLDALFEERLR